MADKPELESLYREAQSAMKAREYDRAGGLLKQILVIDENYRDASRLLARIVREKRRRWYNHPLLWSALGMAVIIGLGIWLAPHMERFLANQMITPTIRSSDTPTATVRQTKTILPTETLAAPTATSIPLTWKRLSIGQEFPHDEVTTIAIDPSDPEVVYIGTANAGIYKSIDGGLSWQPRQNGLEQASITYLLIDPQEPQILYAGAKGLVFKSMDGGNTWTDITPREQSIQWGETYSLIMDQENSQHLYLSAGQQLFVTQDGGLHWESLTPPCDNQTRFLLAYGETVFLARGSGNEENCLALYYSENGGKSWEGAKWDYQSHAGPAVVDWMIRQISPADGERLYLLIHGQSDYSQLHMSMDGGRSWNKIYSGCSALATDDQGNAFGLCDGKLSLLPSRQANRTTPVKKAQVLVLSPGNRGAIFLGGEYGIYISRDNGATWNEQNNGLGIQKVELKLRPEHSDMYLQEQDCGLYHSNDYGRNWKLLKREMNPWCGGRLYFGPHGDTLFWHSYPCKISEDGGETWRESILGEYIPHPFRENWFYQPSGHTNRPNFSYSTDGGNTWNAPDKDLPHDAGLFFSNSEGIIYLVTSDQVYASTDDGQSWQDCGGSAVIAQKDTSLALDPQDSQHLFLATWGKGILASDNGCQSWQESNSGLGSLFINALVIDPNSPDTIYAGTDGGAYISFDSGQTWGQVNDGLLGATVVYSIVVDKDSNVYAATPYGIFKLESK